MARAHYQETLLGKALGQRFVQPLAGATVDVFQPGTTTPIVATIYAADTGVVTLNNPLTADADGDVEFWLVAGERVDLRITASGFATETKTVDVPPPDGAVLLAGALLFSTDALYDIGAAGATRPADIYQTGQYDNSKTDTTTTAAFNVHRTVYTFSAAVITGTQNGHEVQLTYSGATSADDLRATNSVVASSGAGTVAQMFGVYGRATKSGTGVVAVAYANYGVIQNSNVTGAITTGYCYYAATPSATGPITTQIGFNIENQGQAAVTHAYGVWIRAQSTAITTNIGLRNDGTSSLYGLVTVDANFTPQPGGSSGLALGAGATAPRLCSGSGAPTMSAPQGSIYLRTDGSSTSTRAYINSNGTTGWVAVTTAS